MKLIFKIIVGVIFFQIILDATPLSVSACNCYVPENALEALEKSDAVFTGKVMSIKKAKMNGQTYNAVLIEVDKVWKGINESQIIVYTDWSSCQFEFKKEEEYLLYSYKNGEEYIVINCGRSTNILNGKQDLELLGPGEDPSKKVNLSFQYSKWNWIAGSLTVLVLICTTLFFIRRRLKKG